MMLQSVFVVLGILFLMVSCGTGSVPREEVQLTVAQPLNLVLNPDEVFMTLDAPSFPLGTGRVGFEIHNLSDEELFADEFYLVEFFDGEEWLVVPSDKEIFKEIGWVLPAGGDFPASFDLSLNETERFSLVPGLYRLRKAVSGYEVVAEFWLTLEERFVVELGGLVYELRPLVSDGDYFSIIEVGHELMFDEVDLEGWVIRGLFGEDSSYWVFERGGQMYLGRRIGGGYDE